MKQYKVVQTFPVPLQDLLKAREDRYKYLEQFPELKNVELLEEKKEGDRVFQKRKVKLADSLPKVLATLLSDPSLLENSVFDLSTNTHEFTIAPPGNDSIVTIKGVSVYKELGPNESERSYDVQVSSGVFLMGTVIETVIEEIHRHSLDKDKNSISEFLKNTKPSNSSLHPRIEQLSFCWLLEILFLKYFEFIPFSVLPRSQCSPSP